MNKVLKITLSLVLVCITIFTASPLAYAALYTPETCPEFKSKGKHRFDGYSSKCYYCDYVCPHTDKLMHNDENSFSPYETEGDKHYQRWTCKTCGTDGRVENGTPCTWEYSKESGDTHRMLCKVCANVKYGDCVYKTVYKQEKADDVYHTKETFCTICKTYKLATVSSPSEKHTYKNNKCTVCGFVKIIPGKTGAKTFKCISAKKVKRTTYAHWDQNWNWVPAKTYYVYVYKFKVKLKKAKKADYYLVSDKKAVFATNESGNRQTSKKVSFTYVFESSKPKSKVNLYLTAISKSGTPGKTVKKAVKFKKVK